MEENAKSRIASKSKERRQPFNQTDGPSKRNSKHQSLIKNDVSHLAPPQALGNSSPVKKFLNDANKIVKLGVEKEFTLFEKDATLQNLSDTVDNLRKNIIHLQMEYEKLDQNYQRETSYRSELIKRMDATKSVVDSAVNYSNKLSASVKQLEDDKLRIAELYSLIFQNQKEVEEKHSKLEKLMKEKDALLKSKIDEIKKAQENSVAQKLDTIAQLNRNLSYMSDKLKVTSNEKENLKSRIKEFEETISSLEASFLEQQKLNNFQQDDLNKHKNIEKELKCQKIKYQKLFKNKKKQIVVWKNKNKSLMRNYTKIEALYKKCLSTVESLRVENEKCKAKLSDQIESNASKHLQWESEKKELQDKLLTKEKEKEEFRKDNENLKRKNLELIKREEIAKAEIKNLQNDYCKLKNEEEELSKENDRCREKISEIEDKLKSCGDDLNSKIFFYKKESERYQTQVKEMETELSKLQKSLSFERNQQERLETDFENKLKLTSDKVNNMENLIEDKINEIKNLNFELKEKTSVIQELKYQLKNRKAENDNTTEDLLSKLQAQNLKNEELNTVIEDLTRKNSDLNSELKGLKNQVLDLNAKLKHESSSNKILKESNDELENNVIVLKKDIEEEKKAHELVKQNCEREFNKIKTFEDENSALKSTIADLKGVLQGTEARVEAYKVVVKKLETEKAEIKNSHSKEVLKLKSELTRLEDLVKKDNSIKIHGESPLKSTKEKMDDDPEVTEIMKFHQASSTPLKNSKKFLSTPRKSLISTTQPETRSITSTRKKRDPYEFDSDSSVERFDAEKVLKVFNNRPKKETTKKFRTNK